MKLEAVLETLGEEDETHPTILAALKKAQSQAQERPVSDRIVATKSFLLRAQKRVEHAAQVAVKAREALEEALASQAKEEGLLADGQKVGAVVGGGAGDPQSIHSTTRTFWHSHRSGRLQAIIDRL